MLRALAVCLFTILVGCKAGNEGYKVRAIIGAVLIDGNGGPPITDSVVVVSGSRIRSAGMRANVPIPAESDKINGSGKFLTPGLIDLYATADNNREAWLASGVTTTRLFTPAREFTGQTGDAEAARRKVAELAAQHADFLFVRADDPRLNPAVTDLILEDARKYNLPVTASIRTLSQTQQLVKSGAAGFIGMIGDTEDLEQEFLRQLGTLKIVFTPLLASRPEGSERAMRNTKRMAAAGVPIGVGSGGASPATIREMERLAEAGLSPLEITMAATRAGALALRKDSEIGTIEPGKQADLLLLNANPLEDVRNFQKIDQVMAAGEWIDRPASKTK